MRIDQLTPGANVTLGFAYGEEPAQFVGITGVGEGRKASFISSFDTPLDGGLSMQWEAYRYEGHWAYGTGAEPLRLIAVEQPPLVEVHPGVFASSNPYVNQDQHVAASHAVDRKDWTREQWISDAEQLMGDIDGSVRDLLNGHVLALLAEVRELRAKRG